MSSSTRAILKESSIWSNVQVPKNYKNEEVLSIEKIKNAHYFWENSQKVNLEWYPLNFIFCQANTDISFIKNFIENSVSYHSKFY